VRQGIHKLFNRLGPGKYHFRVTACNNDGVRNEEGAHLDFNIAPAWYQTTWFRGLYHLYWFDSRCERDFLWQAQQVFCLRQQAALESMQTQLF
jgi:hypothetical protein